METKLLNIVIARHDLIRTRAGESWESYIYRAIEEYKLSMAECVEIAYSVGLSDEIQAEIEIRLYERAGAKGALERAVVRYEEMFADRRGV